MTCPLRRSEKSRTRSRTRRTSRALEAAYARHRAGDLGGAEQAYRQVLALDPDNAPALSHLAAFEHRRGNLEAARVLLSRAVESEPGDAGARSNLGNLLQAVGRPAEALSQYREALRLKPSHLSARYNLGKALQRLGELAPAEECFAALCALAPDGRGRLDCAGARPARRREERSGLRVATPRTGHRATAPGGAQQSRRPVRGAR